MNEHYIGLLRWSESNKKKLTSASEALKRNKRSDAVVNKLHEEVFEEIDCLECANCCRTTGPLLTSADISRISTRLKLSESKFTESYLRVDEDGDYVFKSMPCPFLGEDNKCAVYAFRPRACKEFPHTDQPGQLNIMHLTRKNARICPAVSRIFQLLQTL